MCERIGNDDDLTQIQTEICYFTESKINNLNILTYSQFDLFILTIKISCIDLSKMNIEQTDYPDSDLDFRAYATLLLLGTLITETVATLKTRQTAISRVLSV